MIDIASTITLNNKTKIPRLGLGVYQSPAGEVTENAVKWAIESGYRHIDTAKFYRNEASVGKAIVDSKIKREDIWVTTKLWPTDQLHVQKAFDASMDRLGLDYVDLYLIHFPVPTLIKRTWKTMEKIYQSGRARAIGISNFSVANMKEVLSIAEVVPTVNQVRSSAFHFDSKVYDFCQKQGIAFEAYSPLTQGDKLDNNTLKEIANHYNKTPAQILIRWALQKDMIVIPKSIHRERIVENAAVYDFEISEADMRILTGLSD